MNFDKNLIHIRRTHFQGEPDAEKIREIDQELTKCSSDKGFFTIATLLYVIEKRDFFEQPLLLYKIQ